MPKTMTALVVAQTASASTLVRVGDPKGAQKALMAIADGEGDKALTLALKNVPASDLGQILVATATSPSAIVAELVTPAVFVKALTEVPKTWTPLSEQDAAHQLSELFSGVVMRPGGKNEKYGHSALAFLSAIEKDAVATSLLAWWLAHNDVDGVIRPRKEGEDDHELHEGEWDHLLLICREKAPRLFTTLKLIWGRGALDFSSFLSTSVVPEADSAL